MTPADNADMRESRAFAPTSADSSWTSQGTSTLLATEVVLPSTSTTNASGKKNSVVRWRTMSRLATSRPRHDATSSILCPPGNRSTTGPRNGPTTAKGASVSSR